MEPDESFRQAAGDEDGEVADLGEVRIEHAFSFSAIPLNALFTFFSGASFFTEN
jgi:hypothetical protein